MFSITAYCIITVCSNICKNILHYGSTTSIPIQEIRNKVKKYEENQIAGIYTIYCISGRCENIDYIGMTNRKIADRRNEHNTDLARSNHMIP